MREREREVKVCAMQTKPEIQKFHSIFSFLHQFKYALVVNATIWTWWKIFCLMYIHNYFMYILNISLFYMKIIFFILLLFEQWEGKEKRFVNILQVNISK